MSTHLAAVREWVTESLRDLGERVRVAHPSVLIDLGEVKSMGHPQPYITFLRTVQEETLDLCVPIKDLGDHIEISADLVRGGSGTIFSEMVPIAISGDLPEDVLREALAPCRTYILSQESRVVQTLAEEPAL